VVLRFWLMVKRGHVFIQPQASKEEAQHETLLCTIVSVKETAVCIVDEIGKICRETKVATHPDDLILVMKDSKWQIERIGLEAAPLSQ
jgi:transposase